MWLPCNSYAFNGEVNGEFESLNLCNSGEGLIYEPNREFWCISYVKGREDIQIVTCERMNSQNGMCQGALNVCAVTRFVYVCIYYTTYISSLQFKVRNIVQTYSGHIDDILLGC